MNDPFIREFIFDEEQQETLLDKLNDKEPEMRRAGVHEVGVGSYESEVRTCDHVPFDYLQFPDISLELLELSQELDPDLTDIMFRQYEFIRYEGNSGQQFKRHQDDIEDGSGYKRLLTSVTMIEKSDDLRGGILKVWVPCGNNQEREYHIDLDPFETIIFPACYWHEATPVLNGRRVVLISWAERK